MQTNANRPFRRQRQAIALLAFLTFDFLLGGIYFLYGFVAFKSIGPVLEEAASLEQKYGMQVTVDTSEYLWWALPFLALAAVCGGWLIARVQRYRHAVAQKAARDAGLLARPRTPRPRYKEKKNGMVQMHVVEPQEIRGSDLRTTPSWLIDPLAVLRPENATGTMLLDLRPRTEADTGEEPDEPHEIPYGGELQYIPPRKKEPKKKDYR